MNSWKPWSHSVAGLAALFCMCLACAFPVSAIGVEEGRTEVVSVIQDYGRPLSFKDEKGKITGFSVDVIESIAARAGLALRHTFVQTYDDLVKEFTEDRGDLTPSIAISDERRKIFDFTEPYEVTPLLLFVRSDSAIDGLKPGMKVGAVRASAAVRFLKAREGVIVEQYPTYEEVVRSLLDKKTDAFTASEERVKGMLKEMGIEGTVKAIGPPVGDVRRSVAVKKGNVDLINRLNEVLREFVGSAECRQIYQKWFGRTSNQ